MLAGHMFLGLILSFLALILDRSGASYVIDVYRALQYDRGTRLLGSRKTYISAPTSAFDEAQWTEGQSKPKRQTLAVKLSELTRSSVDVLLQSTTAGALVLMPRPEELSAATLDVVQYLERKLLTETIEFPVYLAVLTEQLNEAFAILESRLKSVLSPTADDFSTIVQEREAAEVKDIPVVSFQGLLHGAGHDDSESSTFALVTHYDTMGAFPALKGSDHHRTAVVATFEIARLFSRLYAATPSLFNLQFLLSGGGRLNYYGTRQWLQNTGPAVLDTVEFALCLESIAGEHLYLHISRRPKDGAIQRLYETFNQTAERMGVPFTVVFKKINVSSEEMAWEHEAFAYKKIIAATLSDSAVATPQFTRASPLNLPINEAILERNIAFVAEVMAQHIYGSQVPNTTVFKGNAAVSPRHISSWLNYLSSVIRCTPYILKDSPMLDVFEQGLKKYVTSVRRDDRPKPVELRIDVKFYNQEAVQMQLNNSKPLLFDLLLLVPIVTYLLGINIYFRGFQDIQNLKAQLWKKYFGEEKATGNAKSKRA